MEDASDWCGVLREARIRLQMDMFSEAQLADASRFCATLATAAQRTNLIGQQAPEGLVELAFADAWLLEAQGWVTAADVVIDVGSGAGLPALPLQLATGCTVHLVEPRKLRADFLCGVRDTLGIGERAHIWAMKECHLPMDLLAGASLTTARAVFPPEIWLKKAPRLAKRIVVFTTPNQKLDASGTMLTCHETIEYALPFSGARRQLTLLHVSPTGTQHLPRQQERSIRSMHAAEANGRGGTRASGKSKRTEGG